MKKISLIGRILIALVIGILLGLWCKSIGIDYPIRILGTFSGLFGNFLSFMVPLIIIGFIVPGIASLGRRIRESTFSNNNNSLCFNYCSGVSFIYDWISIIA